MTCRLVPALLFVFSLVCVSAQARDIRPDDIVSFELTKESWVSTKSALVTLAVNAAVSGNDAGSMRKNMTTAINNVVKADWRLISFNRNQDNTGLERWFVTYEARLEESALNSLGEKARGASKAGMQITVQNIDFSPTLEEREAAKAALRTAIYKSAKEQLELLNSTIPGRNYRISAINFSGSAMPMIANKMMMARGPMAVMAADSGNFADRAQAQESMERSEKLVLQAQILFAALPPESK
ncbi:MAG: hypothetical protein FWF24_02030 [Alphaproteobacteria bacterium]|nr:hypothetical protein [Alphaproteobacteria bacterium]